MKTQLFQIGALLGLLAWTCEQSSAADPPVPIEKLIEQLASPSFLARERATKQLRERGPEVLPALRKALESKDEEVRKRAEVLIPPLEIEEALLPKRVTLKVDARPVRDMLKEIEKQTGYKFIVGGKIDGENITIDVKDEPFWETLERVNKAVGHTFTFDSYQKTFHFKYTAGRSPFVNIRGPFRLDANWFHEDRDVNLARVGSDKENFRKHQLTLSVELLAEPRITFLRVGPAKIDEAVDSEGNSLMEPAKPGTISEEDPLVPQIRPPGFDPMEGPSGRGTFRGVSMQMSDIRLRRASETAKTLKLVRGTIPVKTILIRKNVVITNKISEATGTMFKAGNDGLTITRVTAQGGGQIEVEVSVPPGENGSYPQGWDKRFHVEDDEGNRFQSNGGGSRSNGKQYWISGYYSAPFNKKAGPPTKFIFEDWIVHEHSIPFEFKDVPIP
jgi:hypothetical protein